ncbi:hypothetical protein LAZ67_10003054 [Cordylochernes scorpioides]|uniref:Uncharacterized protein n=1 Tax=Cordylochernes scorpioides TaxID=51811 RepID=A0ABY6KX03_9ARAC|nr:hypothetical protein LAZ67_10003054 [Cordylochernes scorpioides]
MPQTFKVQIRRSQLLSVHGTFLLQLCLFVLCVWTFPSFPLCLDHDCLYSVKTVKGLPKCREDDHNEEGRKPVQIEARQSKDGGTNPPVQRNDQSIFPPTTQPKIPQNKPNVRAESATVCPSANRFCLSRLSFHVSVIGIQPCICFLLSAFGKNINTRLTYTTASSSIQCPPVMAVDFERTPARACHVTATAAHPRRLGVTAGRLVVVERPFKLGDRSRAKSKMENMVDEVDLAATNKGSRRRLRPLLGMRI